MSNLASLFTFRIFTADEEIFNL